MDWKWNLINALTKERFEEDQGIDSAHEAVHNFRKVVDHFDEQSNFENASKEFFEIMTSSHMKMSHTETSPTRLRTLRKVYTEAALLRALIQSLDGHTLCAISTLDHAVIVAGPYGQNRLELILDTIKQLQQEISSRLLWANTKISLKSITPRQPGSSDNIASFLTAPSFIEFQTTHSHHPFMLRGYAKEWPALTDRPWRSHTYLTTVSGHGRVVPVEIGDDYRTEDWQTKIMSWDEYLSFLEFEDRPASKFSSSSLYMAQYDLLKQFPDLRNDIRIPDYVYADLESPDLPSYHPPENDDRLIMNAWIGPEGTTSPAHVDPFFNFYGALSYPKITNKNRHYLVQVVGYKKIWLAPPAISKSMYPLSEMDDQVNDPSSSSLSNTSRINVFSDQEDMRQFPNFVGNVKPVCMVATLGPGDALFFPPGWWHAMKSESTSFSVSMWF